MLLVTDVFGVKGERGSLLGGLLEQDGLEEWLDDVQHVARVGSEVVPSAIISSSPGPHPDEFGPGETGGERRVAHQLPRARVTGYILRDPEIAEDLVGSLVGDVRAGAIGHPIPARPDVPPHPAIPQPKPRLRTPPPAPHH